MRYFMEVLTIVIGVALADPVPEAAAAFKTAKNNLPSGKKAASHGDVWARIRSGMGISRPAADQAPPAHQESSELQAAVRSGSLAAILETPESSRLKFAPARYTALGRKLLGVKLSPAAGAGCTPFSENKKALLNRQKSMSRLDQPRPLLPSSKPLRADAPVKTASLCAERPAAAAEPDRRSSVRKEDRLEKQDPPSWHPGGQAAIGRRIDKFIAVYTRNPDFLYRVAERARPYLYHILEELSRYSLPLELALLPIVESAYRPTAESPKNAKGLWQFVPGTGIDYRLAQSRDYDERLDIPKSTQAAIRFLSGLYRHFNGDWLLALAAYNAGQATVDNAVGRNRAEGLPDDFWSLNLPAETQDYVPRLLALSAIFASPARYGITLPSVKNEPYFVKIKIDREFEVNYLAEKEMAAIAGLAGLSPEQFRRLNPGYLGSALSRKRFYDFLLPPENAVRLRRRLTGLVRLVPEPAVSRSLRFPAEKPESGSYGDSSDPYLPDAGDPTGKRNFAAPFLSLGLDGE